MKRSLSHSRWHRVLLLLLLLQCISIALPVADAQRAPRRQSPGAAQNVVLVMTDGFRWQEMFRGADASLLIPANYYNDRSVDDLKARFLAPTPEERRKLLMPFIWSTLVPQGQIFGDRDQGSDASVTNGFNFSYPGYSETLTGHPDPRIDSNDNKPNPNVTVLEWLNKQPGLEGSVAGFGAWEAFNGILNKERCGFPVNAGYDAFLLTPMTPTLALLNESKQDAPRIWPDEPFDAPEFDTALEYIRSKHPHVLFLSLGETDDWAHMGNYGEYLLAAHRADAYLQRLWTTLQTMPQYRGNTTLLFTTDHGRGPDEDSGWRSHGQKWPDSKYIFVGLLGAGIPQAGLRAQAAPVTQSQIAATLAKLLGKDWNAAEPQAAAPLPIALP